MDSISGIAKSMLQMRAGMKSDDVSKEQEESMTVSFMELMSQNDFSASVEISAEDSGMEITSVSNDDVKTAYDATTSAKKEVSMKREVSAEEKQSKAEEQLDAYEEEVRKVLKEELGVTDADIDKAMETLGLEFFDLVNTKNLASLIQTVTGENIGTLFLSESFQNIMGQVTALTEALCAELGVTKEELLALCEEWKKLNKVNEADGAEKENLSGIDTAWENSSDANVAVDEEQNVTAKQLDEDYLTNAVEEADTAEMLTTESQTAGNEQTFSNNSGNETANATVTVAGQQNVQAGEFVAPQEAVQPYANVNVTELIEQVAKNIRVNISAQMTSMEMQLNPEHLGKLYLHVSESEGTVRALIAAQTEVVKEALETQLVELRQTLNQQGIKVDAIEVTVATHEFEQNLEGNAKQEEQMQEQMENTQKQARRSLNMNDLDGLAGLMSEEETLVAQIMKDNGNQVDFTA
ncbi:MAG: flagellar hook-length control protein FliK [Lachnospiraceae bacterium]|nr:flagellar hook-length control protein FliK [Lachnospiraceae bacterium]